MKRLTIYNIRATKDESKFTGVIEGVFGKKYSQKHLTDVVSELFREDSVVRHENGRIAGDFEHGESVIIDLLGTYDCLKPKTRK